MLLGRVFAYADAHRHRIGVNYKQIPVNRPQVAGAQLQPRTGPCGYENVDRPRVRAELEGRSRGRPGPLPERRDWEADGEFVRAAYTLHAEDDDLGQAGTLVRDVLDDAARDRLVGNVVGHLCDGVSEPVLDRAFEYWRNIDKDLGDRIADQFGDV